MVQTKELELQELKAGLTDGEGKDPDRRACQPCEITQEHEFRTKVGIRSKGIRC